MRICSKGRGYRLANMREHGQGSTRMPSQRWKGDLVPNSRSVDRPEGTWQSDSVPSLSLEGSRSWKLVERLERDLVPSRRTAVGLLVPKGKRKAASGHFAQDHMHRQ